MGFGSFFKSIFKPVKAVVKWVGDAVADVVDFVVDDILEPVIDVVGGVVQGMLDDPLTTLATFAAMVIPGAQWTIPLIQGASTAIKGGDLGDIAISMAASYAGGKAGAYVGKAVGAGVSGQAAGMGFQVSTQNVAGNIAAQAASQATTGAIRAVAAGGDLKDIGKAAFSGAVFGAATAGASELGDYLYPTDAVTGTTEGADFGFKVEADAFDRFTDLSSSIGDELSTITKGWNKLPDTVQEVIKDGAAASVTSLIRYGEINEDEVASAIARAAITTNITSDLVQQYTGLGDDEAAYLSGMASDVAMAAYSGADPYEAYQAATLAYGLQQLGQEVDETVIPAIRKGLDSISGASKVYEDASKTWKTKQELVTRSANTYNEKLNEFNLAIEKYKNDVKHYNDTVRHQDKGTADKFKADNIDSFYRTGGLGGPQGRYSEMQKELEALKLDYQSAESGLQVATRDVQEAKDNLFFKQVELEDTAAPVKEKLTEQVVETIKPDFDADFVEENYIAPMGLTADDKPITAHQFWLDTGRKIGTSKEEVNNTIDEQILRSLPVDTITRMTSPTTVPVPPPPPPREAAPEPLSEIARTELLSVINNISDPTVAIEPPAIDPVSGQPIPDATPLESVEPVIQSPAISNYSELREYVKAEVFSNPQNLVRMYLDPDSIADVPDPEAINIPELVKVATREWLDVNAPAPLRDVDPAIQPEDSMAPVEAPPYIQSIPNPYGVPTVQNRIEKSIEVANDLNELHRVLSKPDADTDVIREGVTLDAEEVPITVHEQALNELLEKYGSTVNFERSLRESFPEGVPALGPELDLWIAEKEKELDESPSTRTIGYGEGVTPIDVIEGKAQLINFYDAETDSLKAEWRDKYTYEEFNPKWNRNVTVEFGTGPYGFPIPMPANEVDPNYVPASVLSSALDEKYADLTEITPEEVIKARREKDIRFRTQPPTNAQMYEDKKNWRLVDRNTGEVIEPDIDDYGNPDFLRSGGVWVRIPLEDQLAKEQLVTEPIKSLDAPTPIEVPEGMSEEQIYNLGGFYNPNTDKIEIWRDGKLHVLERPSAPSAIIKDPTSGDIISSPLPSEIEVPPLPEAIDRPPRALTVNELRTIDPILTYETYVDAAGKVQEEFDINAAEWENLTWFSKKILQSTMAVEGILDYVADREDEFRELDWVPDAEPGYSLTDRIRKDFSSVIYAGGDLATAYHGLVTYLNEDAREGEITKVGKALMEVAMANNPHEYRQAIESFYGEYQAAEGIKDKAAIIALGTANKIGADAAEKIRAAAIEEGYSEEEAQEMVEKAGRGRREVIARHLVGNEVLQEIVPLIATGGAFTAAKWGTKAVLNSKAAAALAKDISAEAIEEISKKWGLYSALGTNAIAQIAETAGAVSADIAAEIKDLALSQDYSEDEAQKMASEAGGVGGAISAVIEGTIGRIPGVPTDKLIRVLAGSGKVGGLLGVLKSGLLEGISEGIEGGFAEWFKIDFLESMDPSITGPGGKYERKWDHIFGAGMLEAVAGKGTALTIGAIGAAIQHAREQDPDGPMGFDLGDVVQSYHARWESDYADTLGRLPWGGPPDLTTAGMDFPTSDTTAVNIASDVLIQYNPTIFKGLQDAQSSDPVISEQGERALETAFGWDSLPTIDMVQNEDGVYVPTDPGAAATREVALNTLKQANPYGWNTTEDVRNAYRNSSINPDYEYTNLEIHNFTGKAGDLLGLPAPGDLQQAVDQDIDDKSVTYGEVDQAARDEGYFGISPEDAKQFTGQGEAGFDESTKTAITEWSDRHATKEDELVQYLQSLTDPVTGEPIPFTATQDVFDRFVGQGGPEFEQDILAQLPDYAEERTVTPRNIRDIYEQEGTIATEADIAKYRGQGDTDFKAAREAEIQREQDPLAVLPQEVQDIYTALGVDAPITTKDKERLSGQYPEAELEGRATEYLPVATSNAIADILGKQGNEVTQADIDFVADLVAQREVLTEANTALQPFTSQELAYDVTGDNVIDINDQVMLEQVMTGQVPQTALAEQSQFAATGLQGQIQQQTAIQNQIAQQIATDQEDKRRMQQQQYLTQLMETSPVEVKTPPPAQIDYVFDPFGESIFATPQQEAMFTDPYSPITRPPMANPTTNTPITIPMQTAAEGGIIEDKTDEILRILGENK